MARQRWIWPEFWDDPDIGRLSRDERLLFIALFSLADDEGRILADPLYLRGAAFRYDDDLTVEDVRAMRDRIARMLPRSVQLYQVDGRDYIALLRWRRWQRPKYPQPSRFPPPPEPQPAPPAAPLQAEPEPPADRASAGPERPPARSSAHDLAHDLAATAQIIPLAVQRPPTDQSLPEHGSSKLEEPYSGNGADRETLLVGLGRDGLGNDRDGLINTNDRPPDDQPPPAPSARPQGGRVRGAGPAYDPQFERAWAVYPRRVAKRAAYRAWQARLKDRLDDGRPITADMLYEAARNYAEECRRSRREARYILHGSTFWGPSHRFADYLEGAPARAAPPTERPIDRWLRGVMARDAAGGGRRVEGAPGCVPA